MCGIVGGTGIGEEDLLRGMESIAHRGPDAAGRWISPDRSVLLGHRRLSIIDLDPRANQPMVCRRTGNVLLFNGEVYNYRSVRETLQRSGWSFSTSCDSEVVLAAYGEWGEECLSRFNGMFALAVYEPSRRRFFLARDRVGKKPLFYTLHGGRLLFASEIKALLAALPLLPRTLDREALSEYLTLGYLPGSSSIYRAVRKLPPASCAFHSPADGGFTVKTYWSPPLETLEISEEEGAEELECLLRDAVRLRLESDVPVGLFLSGGLDSSLVAAMVAGISPGVVAYTARFPVARYDETPHAAGVARHLGLQHRVVDVDSGDLSTLQWLGERLDEPLGDSSILPTHLISRAIREHVKVVLSGDGGDELFGGYDHYDQVLRETRFSAIPRGLRSAVSLFHRLLPVGCPGKNFLRRLPHDGAENFLFVTATPEQHPRLPLTGALRGVEGSDLFRRRLLEEMRRVPIPLLKQMTLLDFLSWLPDGVLVKVDRASMLASLEVRSPLLDYRIAEFAFRLPDRLRVNGRVRKYLLKRVARPLLPPGFAYERKQGFSIPEDEWFRGGWSGALAASVGERSAVLEREGVAALQQRHRACGRHGKLIYRLLALSRMEKNFGLSC